MKVKCYTFPPFSRSPYILCEMRVEHIKAIMIVPFWLRQVWFPTHLAMLHGFCYLFLPENNLLFQRPFLEILQPSFDCMTYPFLNHPFSEHSILDAKKYFASYSFKWKHFSIRTEQKGINPIHASWEILLIISCTYITEDFHPPPWGHN